MVRRARPDKVLCKKKKIQRTKTKREYSNASSNYRHSTTDTQQSRQRSPGPQPFPQCDDSLAHIITQIFIRKQSHKIETDCANILLKIQQTF